MWSGDRGVALLGGRFWEYDQEGWEASLCIGTLGCCFFWVPAGCLRSLAGFLESGARRFRWSGLARSCEMSRREEKRRPVSIALQDGTSVSGIVLAWSAAGLIAFGGGMAVGVAMGRAKTVEWETR